MPATTDDAQAGRGGARASVPRAGAPRVVPADIVSGRRDLPASVAAGEAKAAPPRAARKPRGVRRAEFPDIAEMAGAVNVKLIYAAYLVALAVPAVALIGVGFALLGRRRSPPAWLASHYTYLVRTFAIGFVAKAVAFALSFLGLDLLLAPLIAVWLVARAVHGLCRAARGEPIDRPDGFIV